MLNERKRKRLGKEFFFLKGWKKEILIWTLYITVNNIFIIARRPRQLRVLCVVRVKTHTPKSPYHRNTVDREIRQSNSVWLGPHSCLNFVNRKRLCCIIDPSGLQHVPTWESGVPTACCSFTNPKGLYYGNLGILGAPWEARG